MSRKQRSYLAQLRSGILPIAIETGRWIGTLPSERLCFVCNTDVVENETHFLFTCSAYQQERQSLYSDISEFEPNVLTMSICDRLKLLMQANVIVRFSKYLCNIYDKRRSILYE